MFAVMLLSFAVQQVLENKFRKYFTDSPERFQLGLKLQSVCWNIMAYTMSKCVRPKAS